MLNPDCIEKIKVLGGNDSIKQGLIDIFKAIVNDAKVQNLPSATCVILFYDETSNLQPGEWAAELHCVARQVESVDETT